MKGRWPPTWHYLSLVSEQSKSVDLMHLYDIIDETTRASRLDSDLVLVHACVI